MFNIREMCQDSTIGPKYDTNKVLILLFFIGLLCDKRNDISKREITFALLPQPQVSSTLYTFL